MIIETGHFALILALAVALVQMVTPQWARLGGSRHLAALAVPAAQTQFLLLAISFATLTYAFMTSDFSVKAVWQYSHSAKPMIFKFSGVWGNHEGSMLLWVLILALFGALVATFGNNLPPSLKSNVLSVQGAIAVAFLLFIILTSNPFERLSPAPLDGRGLNPILQDYALAFHPPLLYVGYVGFSMSFSFAMAALIDGRLDAAWARWVRPWTLLAWMFLTVGIAIGSWWAYYELGWGGWWFWDPVENSSFMPWLAGTALLHSALVMEKREALKVWTVLLAILTFSLSMMGAFLVRSGVLTSVHAFANDPERGVYLLGIMALFTGGGLALYAWRAPQLKQGGLFAPISREGALVLNNLLLTVACATVLIGTLYPLAMETIDPAKKISVGAPFFNLTFGPLMIPLLLALPFGPFLAWKRGDLYGAAQRLMAAFALVIVGILVTYALTWGGPVLAPLGIGLALWVIFGSVSEVLFRARFGRAGAEEVLRRLKNLPRAAYGTMLAHVGVGVMAIGIVATTAWQHEKIIAMKPGDSVEVAGFTLTFKGVVPRQGPNYRELVGRFDVATGGRVFTTLEPAKRRYPVQRQATTEAGIYNAWTGDLYTVLGDGLKSGGYTVRIYFNPFVRLIWIGAFIMFFAGVISLSDRRLRVGAPRRARVRTSGVRPQPAE